VPQRAPAPAASLKWATAKVERTGNGDRTQGRERQAKRGDDFNDSAPFYQPLSSVPGSAGGAAHRSNSGEDTGLSDPSLPWIGAYRRAHLRICRSGASTTLPVMRPVSGDHVTPIRQVSSGEAGHSRTSLALAPFNSGHDGSCHAG
jgi:hypothetical protein